MSRYKATSFKNEIELAVIVVGYNSRKYLEECFTSILASTYTALKIIYVDNASTDGSSVFVKEQYPQILIIEELKNSGFASGNNRGIELALSLGVTFVFLLNPDTVVEKSCIENLISQATPDTLIQPLILLGEKGINTNLVNSAGNSLTFLGFSFCGNYRANASDFIINQPIALVSGAAMLIPSNILQQIGAFDETFFMYHEDVDLSWRARLAGFTLQLVPSAKIWHKYSFSRNHLKMYYAERNRHIFMAKNYSLRLLVLLLPFHLVNEVLICIYALLRGWLLEKIFSYIGFIRLLPNIAVERHKIFTMRTKTDYDIKNIFSTSITFSEVKIPLASFYNRFAELYWLAIKGMI